MRDANPGEGDAMIRRPFAFASAMSLGLAIGPSSYREAEVIARKLLAAVGHELTDPYDRACGLVREILEEGEQQCE